MRPITLLSGTLFAVAAMFPVACGGSSGSPSPSPTLPSIQGTYSGPTDDTATTPSQRLLTWTNKFFRTNDSFSHFLSCPGTLTIVQSGATFSGSFVQDATCAVDAQGASGSPVTGQVVNGTVKADGTISFSLTGPAADPLAWTGFSQCTPAATGTMVFTGTVSGTLLDASFAHDDFIQCPNGASVTINMRLRGTR